MMTIETQSFLTVAEMSRRLNKPPMKIYGLLASGALVADGVAGLGRMRLFRADRIEEIGRALKSSPKVTA